MLMLLLFLLLFSVARAKITLYRGDDCFERVQKFGMVDMKDIEYIEGFGCIIHTADSDVNSLMISYMADESEDEKEFTISADNWHLEMLDGFVDKNVLHKYSSGEGVDIYIIDTGVTPDHPEFYPGQVTMGFDVIGETPETDNNGHGTHVSSLAAGKTVGVATESRIIGVKALSRRGSGSTSGIIKSIKWCLSNAKSKKSKKNVMSMSLGGGYSRILNNLVEHVSTQDAWVVAVAAGNSNADSALYSPASAKDNVITVGAADKNYMKAFFSNWGPDVDIFAPGVKVNGAWLDGGYKCLSGTSMATPIVSGLVATLFAVPENKVSADTIDHLMQLAEYKIILPEANYADTTRLVARSYDEPLPPGGATRAPTTSPDIPPRLSVCASNEPSSRAISKNKKVQPKTYCTHDIRLSAFNPKFIDIMNSTFHYTKNTLCDDSQIDHENFEGNVVIVDRGACLFYEKVQRAQAGGATMVLFRNNYGRSQITPTYNGDETAKIQSGMVSYNDIKKLINIPRIVKKRKLVQRIISVGFISLLNGLSDSLDSVI